MAAAPPQTSPPRSRPPAGRWPPRRTTATAIIALAGLWPLGDARAARSCDEWSAEVIAVEGRVEIRRNSAALWSELAAGARVCTGDALQSTRSSRATLILPDGNTFRLDENTAVNIPEPPSGFGSLLELLRGVIHVISRDPRALTFQTPYANAGLEGTEFDIRVDERGRFTEIVVLEGTVAVATPAGEIKVASDHVAVAADGLAPIATPIDRPIERMRWAGHYPPLLDGPLPQPDEEPGSAQESDPSFYGKRAAARLATARLDAADADLARALQLAPRDATALSLQALMALVRADREAARRRVDEALAADPASVAARLAASYVEQSSNDLSAAEQAVRQALAIEPNNPIVLTRLAEVALARDDTATAISSATRARALAPNRSEPLVVLGFANLRAFDTAAAEKAFAAAVELERDSPIARLGLGLALLRRGAEQEARTQFELAVTLDPANPLTRSYVATIYGAEHRAALTERQLALAQAFDPFDPTAWLYSALLKLRTNRPVEALQDFRLAARKNGDRPAFRSRLSLDEDLATRSTGIARLHTEVGLDQLALLDAWRALGADPADFTAHRLLADAYSNEPRHEIARVSEVLVSQLLQPANIAPVKPQLGQQNLILAQRAGPSVASFDEFGSPVVTNALKLRASAAAGGFGTEGHDVSLAGLKDEVSYGAGHYRFSSDGFRQNNDYEQKVASAFIQYRPTHDTSLQADLRSTDTTHGHMEVFFDRSVFSPLLRFDETADSLRLGAKHQLTPSQTLLGSLVYQEVLAGIESAGLETDQRSYNVDIQHIYDRGGPRIQSGILTAQQDDTVTGEYLLPTGPVTISEKETNRLLGVYSYTSFNPIPSLTVTAGLSFDSIANPYSNEDATSPKLGLIWRPTPQTTVRAAVLETLFGSLSTSRENAQPRLEPTQVAGFTQVLFEGTADRSTVRGLALEHEFSPSLFAGWQGSTRETERTGVSPLDFSTAIGGLGERTQEAYLYWLPADRLSLTASYEHGHYDSEPVPFLGYTRMQITRVPMEARYFFRSGLTLGGRASYVEQSGEFQSALLEAGVPPSFAYGEDQFWVLDAFIGYRLPNRRGLLSLNADNLLDESFQFQDIDPTNPSLFPERLLSFRFTLAF